MALAAALFGLALAHPSIALPGPTLSSSAKAGKVKCAHVHAKTFREFSEQVWRLSAWDRGKPPRKVIRAQRLKLKCAAGPGHRKAAKARWRHDQRVYYQHRKRKLAQRERLRYLPYACGGGVRSAIPCSIMWCESGGSYTVQNAGGSGARGKYQFMPSTYAAWCRTCDWSPADQDQAAYRLYQSAGGGPWVCS